MRFRLLWISILALTILFGGCSTHHQVLREEQKDFLKTLEGRKAEVVMSGEKSSAGSDFSINNDSLFWKSADDKAPRSAALSDVNAIVTRDGLLGGVKGFLLGAAVGTAATALIAGSAHGSDREIIGRGITGIIVGGALVIGGTTAGIIIGHPHEYVFTKDSVNVNK